MKVRSRCAGYSLRKASIGDSREARLAAALRENLRRRKEQARSRRDDEPAAPADVEGSGAA